MPNWTTNRLEFNNEEDAKRVWEGMQTEFPCWKDDGYGNRYKSDEMRKEFSFESIVPSPKTKEECPSYAIINENSHVSIPEERPWFNWYEWQCANWGVKWDASDAYLDLNVIWFSTPWGPPLDNLFQKMADKWDAPFSLAVDNEDGGWQEEDYIFTPGEEMQTEASAWQTEENEERRREWEEDEDYDDEENEDVE